MIYLLDGRQNVYGRLASHAGRSFHCFFVPKSSFCFYSTM